MKSLPNNQLQASQGRYQNEVLLSSGLFAGFIFSLLTSPSIARVDIYAFLSAFIIVVIHLIRSDKIKKLKISLISIIADISSSASHTTLLALIVHLYTSNIGFDQIINTAMEFTAIGFALIINIGLFSLSHYLYGQMASLKEETFNEDTA